MTALCRACVTLALAACMAGCASTPATAPNTVAKPARAELLTPERVRDAVLSGRSTKSDVAAAFGEALVIKFESGYEVWVYRLARNSHPTAATGRRAERGRVENTTRDMSAEFVILFSPSGLVAKTRFRPAPQGA